MGDCIFCDIVARRAPASVIHEDDLAIAFMDIQPVTPGHLLIIPKAHGESMRTLDEGIGMHLVRIALRLERALRDSGLRCEGINLFLADGEAAGQEIFHLHLHVFPRFRGDGFRIHADRSTRPPRAELDAVAAQIRRASARQWPGEGRNPAAR